MYMIQTPSRYLQGAGLLDDLGSHVRQFGDHFFILSGKSAMRLKRGAIEKSFQDIGLSFTFEEFGGESTLTEINRIIEIIKSKEYDAVIGIGGGKVADTAKSAAFKTKLPVIIVPTVASCDAPCSCESMIYNEEGNVEDCEVFPVNPNLVLVDSRIIAEAPVHTLIAGMGDAAATYFEARTCYENHFNNVHGTEVSETAIGLSKLCYDLLLRYGYQAKVSAENKIVTPALEKVIEANLYLSGVGFENGGLSCAHSIQDALTTIPECHKYMHGYRVAYGSLCQLVLENRPKEEINQYLSFARSVELPITLAQLGLTENVEETIRRIAPLAFIEDAANECKMPPGTTMEKLYSSIIVADRIGKEFLSL